MNRLCFSLLTDGSSDVVLLRILHWLLEQHLPEYELQGVWADVRPFPCRSLEDKIIQAIGIYPCDLLFVHRDAEKEPKENRFREIQQALQRANPPISVPIICVVPVRMTEAWLLFDVPAIRYASGNENGSMALHLPPRNRIEDRIDPKEDLHDLLKQASGLHGKRLRSFPESRHARRVVDFIEDFSPLRDLSAFSELEYHLVQTLEMQGWA